MREPHGVGSRCVSVILRSTRASRSGFMIPQCATDKGAAIGGECHEPRRRKLIYQAVLGRSAQLPSAVVFSTFGIAVLPRSSHDRRYVSQSPLKTVSSPPWPWSNEHDRGRVARAGRARRRRHGLVAVVIVNRLSRIALEGLSERAGRIERAGEATNARRDREVERA
jgi:hypothetical protein